MRLAFVTTVAAAALSLSVAAVAQTGGGGAGGPGGGASSGSAGGGASGGGTGTSGGAGGGTGTTGAGGGAASGSGGGGAGTSGGAAGTGTSGSAAGTGGGGASGSGSVTLSTQQRSQAVQALSSVSIQPVQENVTVTVGQSLPTTVTQLVDCPQTLESLITGVRDCKVVLINNRYYIIEGGTRRVVTIIERSS